MPRMCKGRKTYEAARAAGMVAYSLFGLTGEEGSPSEKSIEATGSQDHPANKRFTSSSVRLSLAT